VRWSPSLLYAALAVFLASAMLVMVSLEQGSRALAALAALGMMASSVLFLLSIWRPRRAVDWKRIRAEQRLWESGPIGRSWLRVRKRLYNLWKI
jgi:hypothetical protein